MIEIHHLTRRYGGFTAVDDVSFTAAPGRVTGFLGPNGAGKSTTLRMVVGLAPPTSGRALVHGQPYAALPNPSCQVGVMLDAAAQHEGRTGRETLTLAAMVAGVGRTGVEQALDRVGLTRQEARRRVGAYSLGMRQRLGLAVALIGGPSTLVLDEPANGLDPAGIRWMRTLLRRFADDGGTVLLSSHLLHEIELVADDIVVIGRGRVVARGTKQELLASTGTIVDGPDRRRLGDLLGRAHGTDLAERPQGGFVVAASPTEVGRLVAAAGIAVTELRATSTGGLEEMFLQITADHDRDAETDRDTDTDTDPPRSRADGAATDTTPHPEAAA